MSWYYICREDFLIEGSLKICGDKLLMSFVCPRCGHRQETKLAILSLLHSDEEIQCENTAVCDSRQFFFNVRLTISDGSFKGLLDRPLNK